MEQLNLIEEPMAVELSYDKGGEEPVELSASEREKWLRNEEPAKTKDEGDLKSDTHSNDPSQKTTENVIEERPEEGRRTPGLEEEETIPVISSAIELPSSVAVAERAKWLKEEAFRKKQLEESKKQLEKEQIKGDVSNRAKWLEHAFDKEKENRTPVSSPKWNKVKNGIKKSTGAETSPSDEQLLDQKFNETLQIDPPNDSEESKKGGESNCSTYNPCSSKVTTKQFSPKISSPKASNSEQSADPNDKSATNAAQVDKKFSTPPRRMRSCPEESPPNAPVTSVRVQDVIKAHETKHGPKSPKYGSPKKKTAVQLRTEALEQFVKEQQNKDPKDNMTVSWRSFGNGPSKYKKNVRDKRGVAPKKSLSDLP